MRYSCRPAVTDASKRPRISAPARSSQSCPWVVLHPVPVSLRVSFSPTHPSYLSSARDRHLLQKQQQQQLS
jgi:hypothetical protein